MPIENYLKCVDEPVRNKVLPLINYIEVNYPTAVFDEYYSEKSHIPTWRINDSYVGIGCRKHYISVYFGTSEAAQIVAENTPYCRALKSCVNLSYKRELPYAALYKGIDTSFNNKDKTSEKIKFNAIIQEGRGGGAYVAFPRDIKKEFGKGRLKVNATFEGIPYKGSVVNMGVKNPDGSVCYILGMLKEIRNKLEKQIGDSVYVEVEVEQ